MIWNHEVFKTARRSVINNFFAFEKERMKISQALKRATFLAVYNFSQLDLQNDLVVFDFKEQKASHWTMEPAQK